MTSLAPIAILTQHQALSFSRADSDRSPDARNHTRDVAIDFRPVPQLTLSVRSPAAHRTIRLNGEVVTSPHLRRSRNCGHAV